MRRRGLFTLALVTFTFAVTGLSQRGLTQSAFETNDKQTDRTPKTAIADNSSTPDTADAPPVTLGDGALQGGVQKVHVSLSSLKTVGLDLKNLLKGASSLYDEVTIQPVTLVTEPEVIGYGTVINIPIGTQPVGPPAPARKDRVDLAMSHITPTVTMLKSNVDDFVTGHKQLDLPANIIELLKPQLTAWVETVDAISTQESKLESLTKGAPYDQPAVAQVCITMEKSIKDLDDTPRSIYKVLRKHGKELNNDD